METIGGKKGPKPKMIITGASGLLGHPLCGLATEKWRVYALYHRRKPLVEGVTAVQADLTDLNALAALISTIRPQTLIHAAAAAQVTACQADPPKTARINVDVPARLADLCAAQGIHLIFISTDLVFDGRRAPYREAHPVRPLCVYAEQKVRAEKAVRRRCPQALVCRLPLMFGVAPHAEGHFSFQMLKALQRQQPLNLFVDEFRTPVDTLSAAQGILLMLERAQGLVHLGGRERISRYDLGLMMAEQMQIAPTMIRPIQIADAPLTVPRAPDCSLDSRTAFDLGYDPAPLTVGVQRVVNQFKVISAC